MRARRAVWARVALACVVHDVVLLALIAASEAATRDEVVGALNASTDANELSTHRGKKAKQSLSPPAFIAVSAEATCMPL